MKTVVIDCQGTKDEADFWRLYLEAAKPEGAHFFGRNMAAFWDAISAGGPGWPGEAKLVFVNAAALSAISGGQLLHRLQGVAAVSQKVQVVLGAAT